jgi:phosphate starvation-inducible PhoH-like protein
MKMFLTRIGAGTRTVVTGDPTQNDLPYGKRSGLGHALRVLRGVDGIAFCSFTSADVMRHQLVQRIVLAYDREDQRRRAARPVGAQRAEDRVRDEVVAEDEVETEVDVDGEADEAGKPGQAARAAGRRLARATNGH